MLEIDRRTKRKEWQWSFDSDSDSQIYSHDYVRTWRVTEAQSISLGECHLLSKEQVDWHSRLSEKWKLTARTPLYCLKRATGIHLKYLNITFYTYNSVAGIHNTFKHTPSSDLLLRSPKRSSIRIAQHSLGISSVSSVDSTLVLVWENLPQYELLPDEDDIKPRTSISNPTIFASSLTSVRSNSTDGSLVLLFSQCQRRGPGDDDQFSRIDKNSLERWYTKVDPNTARGQYSMNNSKVVHNVFGLSRTNSVSYYRSKA